MININDYEEFICLGNCCEPKLFLKEFITIKSFPFDWLIINNINDIIIQLETNFENFCNIIQTYNNLYNSHIPNIKNTSIFLPHFNGNIDILKHKIDNFNKAINKRINKKILFILKNHVNNIPSKEEINELLTILKKKSDNFHLLIVNEYLENKNIKEYHNCLVYNHIENNLFPQKVESIMPCCIFLSEKHLNIWKKIFYIDK